MTTLKILALILLAVAVVAVLFIVWIKNKVPFL